MADQSRIPKNFEKYYQYMFRTANYLLKPSPEPFSGINWQRFNWTEVELQNWLSLSEKAKEYYMLYSSPLSRTATVIKNFKETRERTAQYNRARCLLDRIASNPNVTVFSDYSVFNIKRGSPGEKIKRTRHKTPINEQVFFSLRPRGGGVIEVRCRTFTGARRPHRHKIANCVQVAMTIGSRYPKSVNECSEREVFSRAKFFLRLPLSEQGKMLFVYARWYNTSYPELAGPWSGLNNSVIT